MTWVTFSDLEFPPSAAATCGKDVELICTGLIVVVVWVIWLIEFRGKPVNDAFAEEEAYDEG